MPYQATIFNVLIASPSDVQAERGLVRDVIYEWNAMHSSTHNMVLQPIGWETHSRPSMKGRAQGILNEQILQDADLVIGIFWARIGTPTGESPGGSVEEVERHMASGKPTMIYFSDVLVHKDSPSAEEAQMKAVKEFREKCMGNGLIWTYDNLNDFRQKFARHLSSTINNEYYFKQGHGVAEEVATVPDRHVPELTEEAKVLLLAAADDRNGYIMHMKFIGGVAIQANNKNFIEDKNPRSRALWEGALEELLGLRLVKALGHKGEIFQMTREGYEMAELLRA